MRINNNFDSIVKICLCEIRSRYKIAAGKSAREITRDMIRVKSSNVWAYAIDVRDPADKTANVYVQFKGPNGGPDDIYVYYDVPIIMYRRWLSAPSKGHFFWKYIRNNYQYAKLTGDKKTKLKNGVNRTI